MDERAEQIQDVIDAIVRIPDPQARARAATEALAVLSGANGTLARLRRDDIKSMRAAGLSYRKIADVIGVHFTRVKQIESGVATGNSARGRAKSEDRDAGGGEAGGEV